MPYFDLNMPMFLPVDPAQVEALARVPGLHLVVARASVPAARLSESALAASVTGDATTPPLVPAQVLVQATPPLGLPGDDAITWYLMDSTANRQLLPAAIKSQPALTQLRALWTLYKRLCETSRQAELVDRAVYASRLPIDAPWPAWSGGEILAVALLLNRHDMIAAEGYTIVDALGRIDRATLNALPDLADAVQARLRAARVNEPQQH